MKIQKTVATENRLEFETCLTEIIKEVELAEGFLEKEITFNEDEETFNLLLKFDTIENFERWQGSSVREHWVNQLDQLSSNTLYSVTGLDRWLTSYPVKSTAPPPKHKLAFLTWVGITALLLPFNLFIAPMLTQYPIVVKTFIITLTLVTVMTYGWMPVVTRLFSNWLRK